MKIPRPYINAAFIAWVCGTTYLPFVMSTWQNVAWFAVGGLISWGWLTAPDEPERPVEPLPYADEYKSREIPRRED